MAIDRFFIKCIKLIVTETLNDRNIPIKTYTETEILGCIARSLDTVVRVADKDTVDTRFKFYCNDFNLNLGNLVIYEGNTYEVVAEPRNTVHRNNHIKTLIRKIDNIKQK